MFPIIAIFIPFSTVFFGSVGRVSNAATGSIDARAGIGSVIRFTEDFAQSCPSGRRSLLSQSPFTRAPAGSGGVYTFDAANVVPFSVTTGAVMGAILGRRIEDVLAKHLAKNVFVRVEVSFDDVIRNVATRRRVLM